MSISGLMFMISVGFNAAARFVAFISLLFNLTNRSTQNYISTIPKNENQLKFTIKTTSL